MVTLFMRTWTPHAGLGVACLDHAWHTVGIQRLLNQQACLRLFFCIWQETLENVDTALGTHRAGGTAQPGVGRPEPPASAGDTCGVSKRPRQHEANTRPEGAPSWPMPGAAPPWAPRTSP